MSLVYFIVVASVCVVAYLVIQKLSAKSPSPSSPPSSSPSSPSSSPPSSAPTHRPPPAPVSFPVYTTPYPATQGYIMLTFSPPPSPYATQITPAGWQALLTKKANPSQLAQAGLKGLTVDTLPCYLLYSKYASGVVPSDRVERENEEDLFGVLFLSILRRNNPALYAMSQYIQGEYNILFLPDEYFVGLAELWNRLYSPMTVSEQTIFFLRNYGIQPGIDPVKIASGAPIDTTTIQTMEELVRRVAKYLFLNIRGKMGRDSWNDWMRGCSLHKL